MTNDRKRPRLGRGLDALLGMESRADPVMRETPDAPPMTDSGVIPHGTVAEIPVGMVMPNPRQPRRHFDDRELAELSESIKANGLVQPIVVRPAADGSPTYELIAGERRLRAAKLAGLERIPAIVRTADEIEQAQLALVENIQRSNLNPIERGEAYRTLIDELGLSIAELAARLGEDRSVISNFLRLLSLEPTVIDYIRAGRLPLGHAKVLAGVTDPAEQLRLAELVIKQELTVRNLERILAGAPAPAAKPAAGGREPSAHLKELENRMTGALGVRVQIRAGKQKGRGKIVINYASLDEFDVILDKLGVKLDE